LSSLPTTDPLPSPVRTEPVDVVLVGGHGYGLVHLRELERLAAAGQARLVACADTRPAGGEAGVIAARLGAAWLDDYRQAIEHYRPQVVVVAAPPHLHASMGEFAMEAGCDLYLEKPPTATSADLARLLDTMARTGRFCQVGFQSLGSDALQHVARLAGRDAADPSATLGATGRWQRDRRYWTRGAWTGRASVNGSPAGDGALSNPFAHAVMNCIAVGGAPVGAVEVERYRANPIEVEDTACLRVKTASGASWVVAVTLCAERPEEPALHVRTGGRSLVWHYTQDVVDLVEGGERARQTFTRRSLLAELLDVVSGQEGSLSCPLAWSRPFVAIVEAVHAAPVRPIEERWIRVEGAGEDAHPIISEADAVIEEAVSTGRLFSELGVAWAG